MNGIPDFRWINANLRIEDVARALDLRFAEGKLHCWHPERHRNGDASASVGIRKVTNSLKCFGCDSRPMGPVDLVRDVLGLESAAAAGLWIADRFAVPRIPRGKHLGKPRPPVYEFRADDPIQLLVASGLWAGLKAAAQRLAPVMLSLGRDNPQSGRTFKVRAAYATLRRFSGIGSDRDVRQGLLALAEISFLRLPAEQPSDAKVFLRQTATYSITPFSDELQELANAVFAQTRADIETERALRAGRRQRRSLAFRPKEKGQEGNRAASAHVLSNTLYQGGSDCKKPTAKAVAANRISGLPVKIPATTAVATNLHTHTRSAAEIRPEPQRAIAEGVKP